MIPYKKFRFPDLRGKLPCPQEVSRNSYRESNTSNQKLPFHFIKRHFCVIFKSVWGSIISELSRIYAGRSGVHILAGAIELSFLQNIQTSTSAHPASKSSFFSCSKVASADTLTTNIRLEPSLKISGAIPPFNLSPSMAYFGTTLFYLNHLPMYISLNRSSPFWSYKGTLSIHHLPLTCTLHDTFISSLLIQLH